MNAKQQKSPVRSKLYLLDPDRCRLCQCVESLNRVSKHYSFARRKKEEEAQTRARDDGLIDARKLTKTKSLLLSSGYATQQKNERYRTLYKKLFRRESKNIHTPTHLHMKVLIEV